MIANPESGRCACWCELHEGRPCHCECANHPVESRTTVSWCIDGTPSVGETRVFADRTAAVRWLAEVIEHKWDLDYEVADAVGHAANRAAMREDADARWGGAYGDLNYLPTSAEFRAGGCVFTIITGRVWK